VIARRYRSITRTRNRALFFPFRKDSRSDDFRKDRGPTTTSPNRISSRHHNLLHTVTFDEKGARSAISRGLRAFKGVIWGLLREKGPGKQS
jgi:hypothetical protein